MKRQLRPWQRGHPTVPLKHPITGNERDEGLTMTKKTTGASRRMIARVAATALLLTAPEIQRAAIPRSPW